MTDTPSAQLDQQYQQGNLNFQYPGYWQLEEFASPEEQSATILTDSTSFWMVSVIRNVDDVEQVLESALAAFEEEYEDLDIYERQDGFLPGWVRQELEFQYQDLVSSVVLQARLREDHVLLVLYQGHDRDLEEYRYTFDQMTATL